MANFDDSTIARFWSKVDKDGPVADHVAGIDACWMWTASCFHGGYGQIKASGRNWKAHRLSWAIINGPIPPGLCVCHRCDNPKCVRPSHLFLGTITEDLADRDKKGRQASGERHGSRTKPEMVPRGDRHGSKTKPERVPRGERNARYTHPETTARGERHGSRTKPERLARGDRNGARIHPERLPRGEKHGLRMHPEKAARGEAQHLARLTEDAVRQIRLLLSDGIAPSIVAARFDVNVSTVRHVKAGRTWKHV